MCAYIYSAHSESCRGISYNVAVFTVSTEHAAKGNFSFVLSLKKKVSAAKKTEN